MKFQHLLVALCLQRKAKNMRKLWMMMAGILGATGLALAGPAPAARVEAVAMRVPDGAIVVDGRDGDWPLAGAARSKFQIVSADDKKLNFKHEERGRFEGPNDSSMEAWLAVDSQHIYLFANVHDQSLFNDTTLKNIYEGDDFEVFIDANPPAARFAEKKNENVRQFIFLPAHINLQSPKDTIYQSDLNPGVVMASRLTPWGYQIEISIPKALFPAWQARPETERGSWDNGLPLTRPRNDTGPATPPLGRGTITVRSDSPLPTGGEAGRAPARTGEGGVYITNCIVPSEMASFGFDVQTIDADSPGLDGPHSAKYARFLLSPGAHFINSTALANVTVAPNLMAPAALPPAPTPVLDVDELLKCLPVATATDASGLAQALLDRIDDDRIGEAVNVALDSKQDVLRKTALLILAKRPALPAPLEKLLAIMAPAKNLTYGEINGQSLICYDLVALARRGKLPIADAWFGYYTRLSNPAVVLTYCWAAGVNGDRQVTPLLSRLLYDSNIRIRVKAAIALGELKDPQALPVLEEMAAHDPHNYGRTAAQDAIKQIKGAATTP